MMTDHHGLSMQVMFDDANEPGIIFQHCVTGTRVSSLWITECYKDDSRDMRGWKGNSSHLSASAQQSVSTTCSKTRRAEFRQFEEFTPTDIQTEDSHLRIMCYDQKILST